MLETLGILFAWAFLLFSSLWVLYLLVLTLAALLPRSRGAKPPSSRRIALLIPAHNESLLIADTVSSALGQRYPKDRYSVLVIADNCTDDTAAKARLAGARVHERAQNPGKGQALHEVLELLLQEDWDAFLVMDADSHIHPDTLSELDRAITNGQKAIQIRYGVLNPKDATRTRAMMLSTASFNALRPQGKTALGLSSGIYGNGFCLTREVVQRVPYLAHSIVEDIEYHMHLLQAGYRVGFLDHVWVKAQMPMGGRGAEVQRVRWERGRIKTIRNYAPALLRRLLGGDLRALDGLLDVLTPPVSLIAMGLVPPLFIGNAQQAYLALICIAAMYFHYLIAAWRYGSVADLFRLTFFIPWYFAWKTYIVASSLVTERELPWMRTDRHAPSKNAPGKNDER